MTGMPATGPRARLSGRSCRLEIEGVRLESKDDANDLESKKMELYNVLAQLAEKYGIGGRTSTVAKLLASIQCERRIIHSLATAASRGPQPHQRFDGKYREGSTFSTVKILDYLKARLEGDGYVVAY